MRFLRRRRENILKYMGIGVISEGGHDAHNLRWANEYRPLAAAE